MTASWVLATLLGPLAVAASVPETARLATALPVSGLEGARRPPNIGTFWYGLPPSSSKAAVDGLVVLRAPLEGRVRITGGRFIMGSTPQEMQDALQLCAKEPFGPACQRGGERVWDVALAIRAEGHAHEVMVSDFELDVTEVTVQAYMRCVAVARCSAPAFPPGDRRYDDSTYPVTHVTWQDAVSYCAWAGGRLPTEAEWELAARGHGNNTFPWGRLYNPHLCNHGAFADDPTDARDGFVGLAPVGSFPDGATPTGLLDMAGNASEWVADWYERDEQQFGYRRGAQTNPKGPAFGVLGHVIRGGSYRDGAHWMRTASRRASTFAEREVGFRCAADVRP